MKLGNELQREAVCSHLRNRLYECYIQSTRQREPIQYQSHVKTVAP